MSSTIEHEALRAAIRTADATERIAAAVEGRESGVRVAQLDRIQALYDEWAKREPENSANFMDRIGDVLRGDFG